MTLPHSALFRSEDSLNVFAQLGRLIHPTPKMLRPASHAWRACHVLKAAHLLCSSRARMSAVLTHFQQPGLMIFSAHTHTHFFMTCWDILSVVCVCMCFFFEFGSSQVQAIESGYFSWADQPMEVFKCRGDHCPGGVPGTCEGGALGPTCDTCPAEQ